MQTVEYMGKTFAVDEDGYIDAYDNWCDEWVQLTQQAEGIEELTDEHWKVITVLRNYYVRNGIAPLIRLLCKMTGFDLDYINELFPSGPAAGACKMAGLPKPTGCV
jgi:tRNA 2-thiouridine synthesizing protein E